jgi:hypothetical protein
MNTNLKKLVTVVAAVMVFSALGAGCATSRTPAHGPRYTEDQVQRAEDESTRKTLTRLSDSIDPATAAAARRIARTGGVNRQLAGGARVSW